MRWIHPACTTRVGAPGVELRSFGMQDHRRLDVYHAAQGLARQAYAVAARLPAEERFTLGLQIRRAAISVGSNIAEGCGRRTARDFAQFLGIALGSTRELEFQLGLCRDLRFADATIVATALDTNARVQVMLTRLIARLDAGHPGRR